MSTKADLLTAWCKWTGDPVPEARHRIRALSEADLLPTRAHPLSYEDLARALLGFVATAQHKDAPEAVRKFSTARCGAASADKCRLWACRCFKRSRQHCNRRSGSLDSR